MARKKKTAKRAVPRAQTKLVQMRPPIFLLDPCSAKTTTEICHQITALTAKVAEICACLRAQGICGGGGGVPADPPHWP